MSDDSGYSTQDSNDLSDPDGGDLSDRSVAEDEIEALFNSFDPDGSGEITFRELYKMLRHNPEGAFNAPQEKKHVEAKPAEPPVDLTQLRARVKLDMFKMEVQNEVLWYTRSRPGRGANNPTIVGVVL